MPGVTRKEIVSIADRDRRLVILNAAITLNPALHEGKIFALSLLAGFTVTLPAAVGSGHFYRFHVGIVRTSNSYIIAAAGSDELVGCVSIIDTDTTDNMEGFQADAVATANTLTLNATTTGGLFRGDWVEFLDFESALWHVRGQLSGSGDLATPFTNV